MNYDRTSVRELLDNAKAAGRQALNPAEGRKLCEAYGISVPAERLATSAREARQIAPALGFPLVMKIVSPDILHKTEANGVIVGIKTAAETEQAFDKIVASAKAYKADAVVEGVLLAADDHRRA